jgi:hypothetical protein
VRARLAILLLSRLLCSPFPFYPPKTEMEHVCCRR